MVSIEDDVRSFAGPAISSCLFGAALIADEVIIFQDEHDRLTFSGLQPFHLTACNI